MSADNGAGFFAESREDGIINGAYRLLGQFALDDAAIPIILIGGEPCRGGGRQHDGAVEAGPAPGARRPAPR